MELVEHLERHLGKIVDGWSRDEAGERPPFQVVRFADAPVEACIVYSTLGLSGCKLHSPNSGKEIRQELVMLARRDTAHAEVAPILQQVGREAVATRHAWLRGDVIGPRGALLSGSRLEALYVANPVYFPLGFEHCKVASGLDVVLAWLVPISAKEACFVRENGWDAFEDAVERTDPDLTDPYRADVV